MTVLPFGGLDPEKHGLRDLFIFSLFSGFVAVLNAELVKQFKVIPSYKPHIAIYKNRIFHPFFHAYVVE